ncbi:rhamnogalacturonate lyase [Stagonosporopsis vannaccii]|nr:rhamnogalacturonate lyase [Stagonosporopsis vannaccii]
MPPRKRPYGDLGDESSPFKSSRTANASRGHAHSSPPQQHVRALHNDDTDDASQEVPDATQGYNEQQYSYSLYGLLHNKLWTSDIIMATQQLAKWSSVSASLRTRRTNRPYSKTWAAKLAKYMDNRSLLIEAHVTGSKGVFDCPIEIRLYGTNEPVERENLLAQMREDKLPVGRAADRKRKEIALQKERQRLAKEAAKRAKKNGSTVVGVGDGHDWENGRSEYMASSSQSDSVRPGPSLEDIIGSSERFNPRNFENVVEDFCVKEQDLAAMPKAAQPGALRTELHPFQLQGLHSGSAALVCLMRSPTWLLTTQSKTPSWRLGALDRQVSCVAKLTLILAPVSVMSNWDTQFKRHIKPEHALRNMFWHGTRKEPITPKQIENYDVVISTKSGPFSITWRRVILDEGHNIRNPKAKKTVAVSNLMAHSRWSLTGTPIINNLKDLYTQVRFLRLSGGLDSLGIFHGAISRPVLAGDPQGNKALQLLMGGIACDGRKKEMSFIDLRLPELSEYVHKFKLFPHEQERYDALEAQAKGKFDVYKNNIGVVDLTTENKEALQKMLQLSIDSQEDCPTCFDTYIKPVMTKCAHIFCIPCLERVIELQGKCPMCHAELESFSSTTVRPAVETSANLEPTAQSEAKISPENTNSKVEQLLQILAASAEDKTNKAIIFSQWTSFLDLIQVHLASAGYTFTRIDGAMSAMARDAALETLDNDPKITIVLASLSVCSAPAIEDQAVDRVHRLGQKRETTVLRLVVEDSVEERVLGIQSDKRKLMAMAFAEKEGGKKRNVRSDGLGDLTRLLAKAEVVEAEAVTVIVTVEDNGATYATKLQYQGSDAVGKAQGHYAGVDGEANLVYTSAKIVSQTSDYIDVAFSSSLGDLHWVIYADLAGAYQYFVNKALPDLSIFRTLWRLNPDLFTHGYNTNKNDKLPEFALYANAPEIQDETFQFPDGSYVTKYDFANYVRERDFVGVYGEKIGSWFIHPSNEYQPGNHLSQTLTVHRESATGDAVQLNVVQDTSHFRVGVKTPQPVGKIWGPWLWYLNDGSISDAQERAAKERAAFPYAFLNDTAYHSRGSIKGKLTLSDGRPAAGAAVFLGDADTTTRPLVQGSNYYYTAFADASGSFSIPNARSGSYGLIAASNGGGIGDVYTNFTSAVTISKGKTTDLGSLKWTVPSNRRKIFQIGDFDKKATGFTNSGLHAHGLTEKSPENLTFTVGTSKVSDWYYASSKIGSWDVVFNASAPSTTAKALLSVSLAGYSQSTALTIYLNSNKTVGKISKDTLTSDPATYRSGTISGEWRFLQYEIAAADLKAAPRSRPILSFYRFFFTTIDPVLALWATYLDIFAPTTVLSSHIPSPSPDTGHTMILTQRAGHMLNCFVLSAILLRYTSDIKIWHIVELGLLVTDFAYGVAVWRALGAQGRLWPEEWRVEDWGSVGVTGVVTLVRLAFLARAGFSEQEEEDVRGKRKGRKVLSDLPFHHEPPRENTNQELDTQTLNSNERTMKPLEGYQHLAVHGENNDSPDTIVLRGDEECPAVTLSANGNGIFDLLKVACINKISDNGTVSTEDLARFRTLADERVFKITYDTELCTLHWRTDLCRRRAQANRRYGIVQKKSKALAPGGNGSTQGEVPTMLPQSGVRKRRFPSSKVVEEMEESTITSPEQWCSMCQSEALFCVATALAATVQRENLVALVVLRSHWLLWVLWS